MIERTRLKPELAATVGQWEYICCHCIVITGRVGVSFTYKCDACGNTNLRFIHTLENLKNKMQIDVGVSCALVLMDSEIPALAENETKRKEGWRITYRKPGRCYTTIDDLLNRGKL
jgi:hypothetical protein